ncbi:MAG TPA: retropepsin-like aspartic protease [Gemmatimonadaceae bacterium]|nr:retropepsin-like aspartic protease [Gemmatimonadaceae bacterium]
MIAHARVRALFALALALCAGCEAGMRPASAGVVDEAAGEIPFRLAGAGGAALIVPVTINGHGPFEFILDTGATLTCVAEATVTELSLPTRPLSIGYGVGVGGSGRLRIVEIDSLRVGSARATELPACALDLSVMAPTGIRVHGLLGLNFLRNFRVSLDFDRNVLTLEPLLAAR